MSRRSRRRGRGEGAKATIDMNSLIDLTFLLLVTFILTIPALEQGISIMLPRAKTDTLPNKNNKANTITVSQTGTFLNNPPITLEALESELMAKVKDDPDRIRSFKAEWPASVPGGKKLMFTSYPGCFCHRRLDEGGLALAEVVSKDLSISNTWLKITM